MPRSRWIVLAALVVTLTLTALIGGSAAPAVASCPPDTTAPCDATCVDIGIDTRCVTSQVSCRTTCCSWVRETDEFLGCHTS